MPETVLHPAPATPRPAGPRLVLVSPAPSVDPALDGHRPPPATARVHRPDPPRPAPAGPPPVDPGALVGAQQVLRLALEVQDGRRSPAQLRTLLTPGLLEQVTRAARDAVGGRHPAGRLNRVHVQQVTPTVAESFATVTRGHRVHAVAARLELSARGWRCTALRLP